MKDNRPNRPEDASLIDVLIDGFEKNEMLGGSHTRVLPLTDEVGAARKFGAFVGEATSWRGPPLRVEERQERRLAAWPDFEIRQAGRGLMVRVKAPCFGAWWQQHSTWASDPLGELYTWLAEDRAGPNT